MAGARIRTAPIKIFNWMKFSREDKESTVVACDVLAIQGLSSHKLFARPKRIQLEDTYLNFNSSNTNAETVIWEDIAEICYPDIL